MARFRISIAIALVAAGAAVALVVRPGARQDPAGELLRAPQRALGGTSVPVAYFAPGPGVPVPASLADAVERELALRTDLAAARRSGAALLERAAERLGSPDWRECVLALDGMARAALLARLDGETRAPLLEGALAATEHPHPNVRAAALAALVALDGADAYWSAAPARGLDEPLAEARMALAQLCGADSTARSAPVLAALLEDADAGVRRAADGALAQQLAGAAVSAHVVELVAARLAALEAPEAEPELHNFVEDLGRWRVGPAALLAVLERVPSLDTRSADDRNHQRAAIAPDAAARREVRALLSALIYAAGGVGDPDDLVGAWFAAARWVSKRQALFARVESSRDRDLGERLFRLGALIHLVGPAPRPGYRSSHRESEAEHAWYRLAEGDDLVRSLGIGPQLLGIALEILGPEHFLELLRPGAEQRLERSPAAFDGHWIALSRAAKPWPAASLAEWLDLARDLRLWPEGLVDALESSAIGGDAVAAAGLVRLLDEASGPAVESAFSTLARLEDPRPWHADLARYVLAQPEDRRGPLLRRLIGRHPVLPLREALLELGGRGTFERELALELLRPFPADDALFFELARWLIEEVHNLDAGEPRERTQAARIATAIVDTMLVLAPPERVLESATLALEHSIGRSAELGRRAVRALGESEAGRALLLEHTGPATDRETRLEAAAALARTGAGEGAIDPLLSGFESVPEDLQLRLLEAFATTPGEELDRFYLDLARGRGPAAGRERGARVHSDLVHGAFAVLPRRAVDSGSVAPIVRGYNDLNLLLAGLQCLGALGARAELLELWSEYAAGTPADGKRRGAWPPAGEEARDVVRGPLLAALAEAGALDGGPIAGDAPLALLAAPLDRAEADLLRRFARRPMASVAFSWRAELQGLRALLQRGALDRSMAGLAGYERLDGRLLLELAELARRTSSSLAGERRDRAEGVAMELAEAAAVSLAGEGSGARSALTDARALVLELAGLTGEHRRAAELARGLADAFAAGELDARAVEPHAESDDVGRGRSPVAYWRSLAAEHDARAHLAAGDRDGAQVHLERAREWARHSLAARARLVSFELEWKLAETAAGAGAEGPAHTPDAPGNGARGPEPAAESPPRARYP